MNIMSVMSVMIVHNVHNVINILKKKKTTSSALFFSLHSKKKEKKPKLEQVIPFEIIQRIMDYSPSSTQYCMTRVSKKWFLRLVISTPFRLDRLDKNPFLSSLRYLHSEYFPSLPLFNELVTMFKKSDNMNNKLIQSIPSQIESLPKLKYL